MSCKIHTLILLRKLLETIKTMISLPLPPHSIQRSFFCRLTEDKKSEKFFRVFYDRMKLAQLEIKATVTVNTSDLGNRKRDDDSQDKDGPVRKKGQMSCYDPIHSWLHT